MTMSPDERQDERHVGGQAVPSMKEVDVEAMKIDERQDEGNVKVDVEAMKIESVVFVPETHELEQAVAKSVLFRLFTMSGALFSITSLVSLLVVDLVTASDKGVTSLNITLSIFLAVCPIFLLFRALEFKSPCEKDPTGILGIFTWQKDDAHGWKSTGGLFFFIAVTTFVLWGSRMNGRNEGAHTFMKINMLFGVVVASVYTLVGGAVEMRIKTAKKPFGACKAMLIYVIPLLPCAMFIFLGLDLVLLAKPAMTLLHT